MSEALEASGAALAAGDFTGALSLAEGAARAEGPSADADLLRARALLSLGRLDEARAAAKACLKRRLGDASALELLDAIDERLEATGPESPAPGGAGGPRGGPFQIGATILREYAIERRLGEGGMGVVYQARSSGGQAYAVKVIAARALGDEGHRQAFLRELSTWLSLPPHPHLAACRFFRTVGDQIAIFAELVDGGSLDAFIAERRLSSLEAVLDVAIQTAWGLSAAHLAGAVHQDVKPSNLLLTRDGVVKVSDFGLAKARPAGPSPPAGGGEVLVTRAGLSAAYCSPEQAAGEPLSLRSDVWSFGVALLEMLLGRPPCRFGPEAPWALEALSSGREAGLFALPHELAEVLSRCLRREPAERWGSMDEIACRLASAYRSIAGRPYPRPSPSGEASGRAEHAERAVDGIAWVDPRRFVDEAGEPPGEPLSANGASSRNAMIASDLAVFERAASARERRLERGDEQAAAELAELYKEKALAHQAAHDLQGALACYQRGAAIAEPRVERGREELVRPLGVCLLNAASCLRALGDGGAAIALQERVVALLGERVERGGRGELRDVLASALHNQSVALRDLGDRAAASLADRAIAHWEVLAALGAAGASLRLASSLDGKALALRDAGEPQAALACHARAVELLSSLAERGEAVERNWLAMACMNMSMTLREGGDLSASLERIDQAIALRERLVLVEGRTDLLEDLALAYASRASTLGDLGEVGAQIAAVDQSVALWERLVHREGRADLAHGLALAYTTLAEALRSARDLQAAVATNERALSMWNRIVSLEPRAEHQDSMTRARINQAIALGSLGDAASSERAASEAISWLEGRGDQGPPSSAGLIAWAKVVRAEARLSLGDLDGASLDAAQALVSLPIEAVRTGRADLAQVHAYALERLGPLLSMG